MRKYLAYFGSMHFEFRIPELEAIAKIFNIPFNFDRSVNLKQTPFLMIEVPSEEAVKIIASRSVTLKGIYDCWGYGKTYDEVFTSVQNFIASNKSEYEKYESPDVSFKFLVDAFGRKQTKQQKVDIINRFKFLNFKGKVKMQNPDVVWCVFEDLGKDTGPKDAPPRMIYFARQVTTSARDLIDKFSLKKRVYLGVTSMDSELSLIMANQALAKPGSLVLDPFVGTGSLLITCAYFGAMTIGGDIDFLVMVGKGKEKNIVSNFKQYNVEAGLLDLVRFDHHKNDCWRSVPVFDAIVCDPPYGIRAGAKKVGKRTATKSDNERKHEEHDIEANISFESQSHEEQYNQISSKSSPDNVDVNTIEDKVQQSNLRQIRKRAYHVPQCLPYSVVELLSDLLNFAARMLVVGGRLVYWLPTTFDYKESDLPRHPCFQIVANSEQPLSTKFCRRLITMEKVIPFDPEKHTNLLAMTYNFDEEPAHANLPMKILKDPSRRDSPLIFPHLQTTQLSKKHKADAPLEN
jgi:tRNA (guanine10-N2)-methyltransferase